ncbi:MAG: hypothetical protein R3335_03745 [Anaerolineales bacterium]|nr:hypothetical protein [Anaerolineales bacterium]
MPLSHKTQPVYRICIQGRLSQAGAAWFEGFTLTIDETTNPVQTCLQGPVMDQPALHGLLSRIRDLGLTLITVQRVDERRVKMEAGAGDLP